MGDKEEKGDAVPKGEQEKETLAGEEEKKMIVEKSVEAKISPVEVKLDLEAPIEDGFKGLTKEELMRFATDPFWVRLRWILFVLFWIIWIAMLVASIVIIIYAPKCPSPDPKQWWQKGPIYKVDIANFKDSNNDGTGDIKGLEGELDYLVETGVNTIYLASFFKGPAAVGNKYGVSDFQDVKAELGTLADWSSLVDQLQLRNMKVIIDIIPNHVSEQHEWFELSVSKDPTYQDFFIWRSTGSAPGWVKNSERGEYYWAPSGLPELNLANPKVVMEMKKVMKFWLNKGVDGFNLDSFNTLVEDQQMKLDLEASKDIVKQFRTVVDNFGETSDFSRILIALTDLELVDLGPLYGDDIDENHIGQLFHLAVGVPMSDYIQGDLNAENIFSFIEELKTKLPVNAWPAIAVSSPVSVIEADMVDAMNMLSIILPATPFTNMGQELGMAAVKMNWDMQKNQTKATTEGRLTHFSVYSELAKLRQSETILFGSIIAEDISGCLVVSRVKKGNPGYLLVINFSQEELQLDLSKVQSIAENIRILTSSVAGREFALPDPVMPKTFSAAEVPVEARQARMFTFVPSF